MPLGFRSRLVQQKNRFMSRYGVIHQGCPLLTEISYASTDFRALMNNYVNMLRENAWSDWSLLEHLSGDVFGNGLSK